ncbi:MAG: HAD family phosphatase [Elusimicrobia bacterium]|nr:HAD family phosphatase [Elusimicrobiota bacterium]
MKRLRAVLFDMDGVLVDSEAQWRHAEDLFFRELGFDASRVDAERMVGLGVADLYDLLSREYKLAATRERFFALSHSAAEEVYLRRVRLADGALDLIGRLRAEGIAVGLASASPRVWVRMVLDRFRLQPQFHATVSIDDVGGEGKPSPAIYLRAAGLVAVPAANCVAIEDSRYGVLAAKRAGMSCIGLRNGSNEGQDLTRADAVIRGFSALSVASIEAAISRPSSAPLS